MNLKLTAMALLFCSAFPVFSQGYEPRCSCIETESRPIGKLIDRIKSVTDSGAHCKNKEIIAILKQGAREVCLNPNAPWVIAYLNRHRVPPMVLEIQERWPALFSEEQETDPDDETRGVKIGIVALSTIQNVAVVLEEKIVLTDLPDLPTAFACLFGLLFALNIDYPKELKYTFEVLETIFMELSTNCTQRVRSLKANLLL
ncbi:hypothetical protein AAFF_G00108820 [Aldrovandia affinis]|uniref:Chemokine interleukin-8-like domain-containing protein n=1 Tax=Aldrovandia affinis TaxID=143900 RepID=A0AAD7WB83_9TELE|nr:hypothetical protein AAFF_G00108820 [Aldrovandia affinis]